MSGHLKSALLVSLLFLIACEEGDLISDPSSAEQPTVVALVKEHIDLTGCWREVNSSSAPVSTKATMHRVAPNQYILGEPPQKLKIVVNKDLHFEQVNFDDKRPVLPPGTSFSTGDISPDGQEFSRVFTADPNTRRYKRCESLPNIPIQKKDAPLIPPGTRPESEPSPSASTFTPLVPSKQKNNLLPPLLRPIASPTEEPS